MPLLFLVIAIFLAWPASALALEIKPRNTSIVYGDKTVLRVGSDSKGQTWQLREALWPYTESETIGEWPATRASLPIKPSRNARYKVLLLDEERQVVDQSSARIVWVLPRVENRVRKTSSYLLASGTLRFDQFFWPAVSLLPAKQKRIYLYSRCSSSRPWVLQKKAVLRIRLFLPQVYISWQTSATLPCKRAGYRTVGFFYLPGILPSGDEGLGRPQISKQEALAARKLLGAKSIAAKKMNKYFPVS